MDECALSSQTAAAKYLHEMEGASPDEILDVAVSVDGTWSKRGFTALYCVVVATWKTGQVLDCEVLSKYCSCCALHESDDHESLKYQEWWKAHKDSCEVNYSGSSPAMEVEGVRRIWLRSVEKLKLRYTSFISDGDSKGYIMLTNLKPYGEDVRIVKHECVNHVSKRMGAAFRKLKASKPTLSDGTPARISGRLTAKTMDALQVYYAGAIRENVGDVDEMEKGIWASFYHSISTDSSPQHQLCPPGKESWCKFQAAIARSEEPPPANPTIPEDLIEIVKPIYERLTERELLERCILGATQNQNESFNNLIWSRCPKTGFCGYASVQSAVSLAVMTFNDGMQSVEQLMEHLGTNSGPRSSWFFNNVDEDRIRRAERKSEITARNRRITKKSTRTALEDRNIRAEGVTYRSGEF